MENKVYRATVILRQEFVVDLRAPDDRTALALARRMVQEGKVELYDLEDHNGFVFPLTETDKPIITLAERQKTLFEKELEFSESDQEPEPYLDGDLEKFFGCAPDAQHEEDPDDYTDGEYKKN